MEELWIKLEHKYLTSRSSKSRLKSQNMYVGDALINWLKLIVLWNIQNYSFLKLTIILLLLLKNKTKFRAGHKLEAAIKEFGIDCDGKIALDSGLSTGGFTDCLLQHGASHVYGVDVGYGQVSLLLWCYLAPTTLSISCR